MNYLITSTLVLLALFQCYHSKEVCYDDLGCFIDTKPFGFTFLRPIGKLPETPAEINTSFKLYNKADKSGSVISVSKIPRTFIRTIPTKVIIHGLNNNELSGWVVDMKNTLLAHDNVNVIVVDWKATFPYEQAVANSLVVGAVTANLIKKLISSKGAKAVDFHLIGFSLGAHTAGYVGKRVKIGRITGLDAAGPFYEGTPKEVRLHKDDAEFVDVIHTNSMRLLAGEIGFGILSAIGDVDYYPNGGKNQPGCDKIDFSTIGQLIANYDDAADGLSCSHSTAYKYFTDSIKDKCLFNSFKCSSFEDLKKGRCSKCSVWKGCNRMGYWASGNRQTGSLYLDTQLPGKC